MSKKSQKLKLGDEARDKRTGYTGRIYVLYYHINGHDQVLLDSETLDGKGRPVEGVWFDANRVELVKK